MNNTAWRPGRWRGWPHTSEHGVFDSFNFTFKPAQWERTCMLRNCNSLPLKTAPCEIRDTTISARYIAKTEGAARHHLWPRPATSPTISTPTKIMIFSNIIDTLTAPNKVISLREEHHMHLTKQWTLMALHVSEHTNYAAILTNTTFFIDHSTTPLISPRGPTIIRSTQYPYAWGGAGRHHPHASNTFKTSERTSTLQITLHCLWDTTQHSDVTRYYSSTSSHNVPSYSSYTQA